MSKSCDNELAAVSPVRLTLEAVALAAASFAFLALAFAL